MSYCVNPDCPKPQNPETQKCCQGCGFNLWVQQRYRAIKLIGEGGFSRTFLAVDETESACVLKQLWTKNLTPEDSKKAMPKAVREVTIALFQQEAQRLKELGQHPQIPTLLAHFEENHYLYLVQEFIDGMNLAKVVEEEGTFSEAQIWQLLDDLLPVLKFIHDHQIIHRDIKPENIIRRTSPPTRLDPPLPPLKRGDAVDPSISQGLREGTYTSPFPTRREGGQLVLVDFGAAKLITGINSLKAGTRIGSPEYVAPEQARGKAVFASDLYSLGVTCIYLLTGIPPFDLFDVVNDRWVWRDYLTEDVSDRLGQILDNLLQNALTRRFQSVDQVMQAIADTQEQSSFSQFWQKYYPGTHSPPPILWQCRQTLSGNSAVNSVAISPNGQFLASGYEDKTVRLWNLETGEVISTLMGHAQGVKSVAFSPDGTMLATGSDDQTIKLWNVSNGQEIYTLCGHSHAVKSVAFSPDGQVLASGSWDKTIKLWNVQTGVAEKTLTGHGLQVSAVAFSPTDNILSSASCDRTWRLWDLASGSSTPFYGHAWAVFAIAFSPDGETLATGSDDNTIILWDRKTGKQLYTLSGHSWSVVAVAYSARTPTANSPDGETLVSGSWDKTIKLWQVSTGKELATLTGHLDSVSSVASSSNGQIIASGSKDKTIKLWHRQKLS
ncbi:serine/threonine-protein kinase [Allocoleopsis sp.]|uniref:serine/threonine-protein kinase n=1 Tax=Allocoleopsis sp. TaxID=3088169 RepID=UPI002FD291F1